MRRHALPSRRCHSSELAQRHGEAAPASQHGPRSAVVIAAATVAPPAVGATPVTSVVCSQSARVVGGVLTEVQLRAACDAPAS